MRTEASFEPRVCPRSLEEAFNFRAVMGGYVWVNAANDDGVRKWRRAIVFDEKTYYVARYGALYSYHVSYMGDRELTYAWFTPGLEPGYMKPETPEVMELLRKAGYFV